MAVGFIVLILLAVCGMVALGGLLASIIWVLSARRRGHGPLVSCPQCGRNSPPSPHCPNCGAALS
jgi:predicted amidophosphoribosyltransferase